MGFRFKFRNQGIIKSWGLSYDKMIPGFLRIQ